ncbi:hypothetical protein [Haloarchaeobius sp. TZWWS8]|uniref:hypothetical protein n=1 Tax=Haloarchaeobius sp. TZWWS8 TaxID=3446121 RepID=UPI003EBC61BB
MGGPWAKIPAEEELVAGAVDWRALAREYTLAVDRLEEQRATVTERAVRSSRQVVVGTVALAAVAAFLLTQPQLTADLTVPAAVLFDVELTVLDLAVAAGGCLLVALFLAHTAATVAPGDLGRSTTPGDVWNLLEEPRQLTEYYYWKLSRLAGRIEENDRLIERTTTFEAWASTALLLGAFLLAPVGYRLVTGTYVTTSLAVLGGLVLGGLWLWLERQLNAPFPQEREMELVAPDTPALAYTRSQRRGGLL